MISKYLNYMYSTIATKPCHILSLINVQCTCMYHAKEPATVVYGDCYKLQRENEPTVPSPYTIDWDIFANKIFCL